MLPPAHYMLLMPFALGLCVADDLLPSRAEDANCVSTGRTELLQKASSGTAGASTSHRASGGTARSSTSQTTSRGAAGPSTSQKASGGMVGSSMLQKGPVRVEKGKTRSPADTGVLHATDGITLLESSQVVLHTWPRSCIAKFQKGAFGLLPDLEKRDFATLLVVLFLLIGAAYVLKALTVMTVILVLFPRAKRADSCEGFLEPQVFPPITAHGSCQDELKPTCQTEMKDVEPSSTSSSDDEPQNDAPSLVYYARASDSVALRSASTHASRWLDLAR
mmetsp:Transcript_86217/g.241149  ORF Transcript_86217/g.241149 Transcript_86217/m.241149 type:complete len:277 (-) Transcript_86217:95-925(-)